MLSIMKRNSIGFRLAAIFVCVVLAQCLVMGFMLVAGGVVSETEDNSYRYFSSQVESRKANFESQMDLIWTDFGTLPKQISQEVAMYRSNTPPASQNDDDLLRAVAPYLVELLKRTKTTGAFLILPTGDETPPVAGERQKTLHSALYIKNLDPNQKGQDSYNLTLKAGPMDIKHTYNFSTSDKWSYKLELDESNAAFYEKTYESIKLDAKGELLYNWSKPFVLHGESEQAVSYSMPIKDTDGQEIGVLGIDISVNYLYEFLPRSDLVGDKSLGFIIAMKDTPEGDLYPVIAKESLHGKVINLNEPLSLKTKNKGLDIFEITNATDGHHIFGCGKTLNMYSGNTPFSDEQWYLVGLMNKGELHRFSDRIAAIMTWALGITVVLGSITAVFITRRFSKPIVRLADEVRTFCYNENTKRQSLSKTGLYEIDQLSEAVLTAQNRMSDLNDKLKHERDRDSLTGIQNRHSFHAALEDYYSRKHEFQNICIGLFDLNELKQTNDRCGHAFGDKYICDSVQLIHAVFNEDILFRIGGDEFAIILTDIAESALAEKSAALKMLVNEYNQTSAFKAGIAFGYAFCEVSEESFLEQAMKKADESMYAEKRRMKGQD